MSFFLSLPLQLCHAASQNVEGKDDFQYKCLWRGCKVFGKGSSSKSWLEKHVSSHSGSKPFQVCSTVQYSTSGIWSLGINSLFH